MTKWKERNLKSGDEEDEQRDAKKETNTKKVYF